jgi:hypothetical protein
VRRIEIDFRRDTEDNERLLSPFIVVNSLRVISDCREERRTANVERKFQEQGMER